MRKIRVACLSVLPSALEIRSEFKCSLENPEKHVQLAIGPYSFFMRPFRAPSQNTREKIDELASKICALQQEMIDLAKPSEDAIMHEVEMPEMPLPCTSPAKDMAQQVAAAFKKKRKGQKKRKRSEVTSSPVPREAKQSVDVRMEALGTSLDKLEKQLRRSPEAQQKQHFEALQNLQRYQKLWEND